MPRFPVRGVKISSGGIFVPLTLNGWKEIASFLRQSVGIVKRWEQEEGLPIHRTGQGKDAAVFAFPHEILQWARLNHFPKHPPSGVSPAIDETRNLHERNVKLRSDLRNLMKVAKHNVSELKQTRALRARTGAPKWVPSPGLHSRVESGLAEISRRVIEAEERERSRIGRELHDNVIQRLALAVITLDQLRGSLPLQPQVHRQIDEVQTIISDASTEIRALSRDLHPSGLEIVGLVSAIKGICREFSERFQIEITCDCQDVPAELPKELSFCLFRVLQEALHNAVKHSGARQIWVSLRATTTDIHLIVRDSGAGFDVRTASVGRGLGLTSIRERVRLVHGTVVMKSKPGAGTIIHACIPYKPDRALAKKASSRNS